MYKSQKCLGVAWPEFEHPLSTELYDYELNTEFVVAVGILRKNVNSHSKAITILKLRVHFNYLQDHFSRELRF